MSRKTRHAGSSSEYPDHSAQMTRINRVIGQLEAIKQMVLARKYCPEILQQLRAARGGLASIEISVLGTHLRNCVRETMTVDDGLIVEQRIDEIVKYIRQVII